jgi:hypothetical protein
MTSSQEPPLTRRELRERERLREQQETSPTPDAAPAAPAQVVPAAPQPSVPQAPPVQQAPPVKQAPVQAAPPVQSPPGYAAPRPAGAGADSASPFGGAVVSPAPGDPFASMPAPPSGADLPMTPERTLTRRELRAMLDANSMGEYDELDFGDDTEQHAMPAPQAAPGQAPNVFDPYAQKPTPVRAPAPHQVAEAAIADEPLIPPRPVGHWTDQLNAPVDRAEPFDQLLSRGGVSHGVPTTTNALILPTLPDHGPMGGSLAASGETIVTGSVDLPRSFGATGVHPSQIDSSDVDRLFDQVEDGAGVGAPVAATRAISTQNAARAMMAPPKKEGMNAPLVLAVTAGVLALGVVATLVIGALTGLF